MGGERGGGGRVSGKGGSKGDRRKDAQLMARAKGLQFSSLLLRVGIVGCRKAE